MAKTVTLTALSVKRMSYLQRQSAPLLVMVNVSQLYWMQSIASAHTVTFRYLDWDRQPLSKYVILQGKRYHLKKKVAKMFLGYLASDKAVLKG